MDIFEAAAALTGCEYCQSDEPKEVVEAMKASGLVAVTGQSDDNIRIFGAIDDEVGIGEVAFFDGELLTNECDDEDCPYFEKILKKAIKIEGKFGEYTEDDEPTWTFNVPFEHATFDVMEDGEIFSRGVVFKLESIQ